MHRAKIVNNRIVYENNGNLALIIQTLNGKEVEVDIKERKISRTYSQNAYYWAVIIPALCWAIKENWGEILDKEEAHNYFKNEFLVREITDKQTAEIKQITKSTTKLSKEEFISYVNKCKDYLLNFDIVVQ